MVARTQSHDVGFASSFATSRLFCQINHKQNGTIGVQPFAPDTVFSIIIIIIMKLSIALAGILAQPLTTTTARQVKRGTRILDGLSVGEFRSLGSLLGSRNRNNQGRKFLSRRLNNQKKVLTLRNLDSLSWNDAGKPCNCTSLDPDVGILSCGKGRLCMPDTNSFLGGTCVDAAAQQHSIHSSMDQGETKVFPPGNLRNQPQQEKLPTECDPTSADVGLLGCGEGQRFLPNVGSCMGGYCESSSMEDPEPSSRKLVSLFEGRAMCNSSHPSYGYFDCDCSGYDIINGNGTGSVPCKGKGLNLGLVFNGCNELVLQKSIVYNFENFQSPGRTVCLSISGAATPQEYCIYESFNDRTCEVTFNDQVCSSCNVTRPPPTNPYYDYRYYTFIDIDCTNVGGGSYDKYSGDVSTMFPIIGECYERIENPVPCSLCPGDNYGINIDYYETLYDIMVNVYGSAVSCLSLAIYSYVRTMISPEVCPAVVAAMDSSCCTPICDICDDFASTNFSAMTKFLDYNEYPCFYLMGILADPTQCAEAKPVLVDACCGLAVSTAGPTRAPTGGDASTPLPKEEDDPDINEDTPPATPADEASTGGVGLFTWIAGALSTYFAI